MSSNLSYSSGSQSPSPFNACTSPPLQTLADHDVWQCTGYWALYLSCMSEFELVSPSLTPHRSEGRTKKVCVGECRGLL